VLDEQELRNLSPQERLSLMRALSALDEEERPGRGGGERRRAVTLAVIIVCCVCLAAWIGLLAVTLPRSFQTGAWRGAWVGFDIAELGAFAATGWALWRRRQILIVCLIVLATLLCCDAWFDVVLDARTSGFWLSLLSAILIELPLAGLAVMIARRLLRTTIAMMRRYQGDAGPLPPLRNIPLAGASEGRPLHHVLAENADQICSGTPERSL
jgi:hypothetical protein